MKTEAMNAISTLKNWFRAKVGMLPEATTLPAHKLIPAPIEPPAPIQPNLTEEQLAELSPENVLRYRLGVPLNERIDTYRALGNDGVPTSEWMERKRIDRDVFEKKWGLQLD